MNFNDKERHILSRSLFYFNIHLCGEIHKAEKKSDEKKSKKNLKIMQEVTTLFEKLGLNDQDMYKLEFDGSKYYDRFEEVK